jgi:glycosyltransferase involved in cell wall biosynthesis
MVTVSVIIPAYNEQATIIKLLTEVRQQSVDGVSFEIIVVDDGSMDGTGTLLENNPGLYDHLIRLPKNSGKGAAVLAGLQTATGSYILFQDADLEYSPTHYKALLHPVLSFDAEIVMGSRFMAAQYVRVQFYWHKIGNQIVTTTFNALFNTTFTDIYSCYLLYRRDLVDVKLLRTRGWEQHAEILCTAVRHGKVIYEVPISYHGRSYEEGKKIRPVSVISVFLTILRCRLFG